MKTTTIMVIVGLSLCLLFAACGQRAATGVQPSNDAVSDADIDSSAQSIDKSGPDTTGVDGMDSDFDAISTTEY